ncbi:hypothetical protein GCM10029992_34640 [Glycomyces albus]
MNRDPVAGLAIFGAVTIVVMSLLIWALTFGSWVEDGSIGIFDHSRLTYFTATSPGLLLPLAIACAVMSFAVFAIGNARRRRAWRDAARGHDRHDTPDPVLNAQSRRPQ